MRLMISDSTVERGRPDQVGKQQAVDIEKSGEGIIEGLLALVFGGIQYLEQVHKA